MRMRIYVYFMHSALAAAAEYASISEIRRVVAKLVSYGRWYLLQCCNSCDVCCGYASKFFARASLSLEQPQVLGD
jgi:hypothetical protein